MCHGAIESIDNNYQIVKIIPAYVNNSTGNMATTAYNMENNLFFGPIESTVHNAHYFPQLYKLQYDEENSNYSSVQVENTNDQLDGLFDRSDIACQRICLQYGYWIDNIFIGICSRQNYGSSISSYLTSLLLVMQVNPDGSIINYNYKILDTYIGDSAQGVELSSFNVIKQETIIDDINYNLTIKLAGYNTGNKDSANNYIIYYDTIYIGVTDEVIAIRYKNKVYYNSQVESLTAGQPDVRAGKTFIGYMGYVEEGTMEVE